MYTVVCSYVVDSANKKVLDLPCLRGLKTIFNACASRANSMLLLQETDEYLKDSATTSSQLVSFLFLCPKTFKNKLSSAIHKRHSKAYYSQCKLRHGGLYNWYSSIKQG